MADNPEDFSKQVAHIHESWYQNKLSFAEACEQLDGLQQKAIADDNKVNEAMVYDTLGIMNGYRGSYGDSIKNFERARQIFSDIGLTSRVANSDLNLGKAYRLIGKFNRAQNCFRSAYDVGKSLDDNGMQAFALANEGQIWLSLKDYEKARTTLEEALTISETEWEDHQSKTRVDTNCEIHHALVSIHLHENNLNQAWEHAVKSLASAEQSERLIRIGYANRALGDVMTLYEQAPDEAYDDNPDYYYEQAFTAFEQVNAEGEVAKTLLAQGHSLVKRAKKRSAGSKFQQAMAIFTRLGMLDDVAETAQAQIDII